MTEQILIYLKLLTDIFHELLHLRIKTIYLAEWNKYPLDEMAVTSFYTSLIFPSSSLVSMLFYHLVLEVMSQTLALYNAFYQVVY